MGLYVGIDLGTTNSTVSVIQTEDSGESPLDSLETCPIHQYKKIGESVTDDCLPSALYFDIENKRVYTGIYAKERYSSGDRPLQTAISVKIRMGGDSRLEIPGLFGKSQPQIFDMKECSSFFIRTIVNSLKKEYPEQAEQITDECIVTVPAAFNDDERVATQNAVLLGGFKRCKILDEPTAALLSHINSDSYDDSADEETTYKLVYDIGGGTLDVSIAKLTRDDYGGYTVDIVGLSERMNLGGDNFDRLLGAYFLKEFEPANPAIQSRSAEDKSRMIARMVSHAEEYKIAMNNDIVKYRNNPHRLSKLKKIVNFILMEPFQVTGIFINKQLLDDLFLMYTDSNTGLLLKPVKTALSRSKLQKEDIGEIILTGGMAEFYAVQDTIKKFFGDNVKISTVDDTKTAVSRGAALYHWGLDDDNFSDEVKKISTISNKLASNIYVRNSAGNFDLLIPSDLSKTSGTYDYIISDENVAYLPFYLYSGTEPENGEDNTATYTQLAGRMIPTKPEYNKGDTIPIYWEIDENKVITVQIQNDANITLSRILTPNEIAQSIVNQYEVNPGV